MKLTETDLREVQHKSIEILLYFKKFCEKHDLIFYLCGGCCIGTIRHKGFIPWDDDIDVFMPRADYEKLAALWEKEADTERYSLSRSNEKINYRHTDTTIQDNHTTFINKHSMDLDINHGLMLDVIPLDGCPSSSFSRFFQIIYAMTYSLFNAQRLPDNQGKILRVLSKIILSIFRSSRLRYKIWSYCERQMTKYSIKESEYITELVTGYKYLKNKYPKKIFEKQVYKEFEGYKMPIPSGYDTYLTMAFGDYMKLPSKEERVPKHNTVYVNLNEGYKKFKNIHYCINQKDCINQKGGKLHERQL
ncbi:LicD family protein [Clostridium botulinum]|uniref:2-C-methyl-D-erythritol 4-phosphate cytidylyltransferase n=1 Tax=Clostridium botulinum TaxID=1491 RepID=A0A9Q1V0A3_CLOBO|nr:LicD family protein [Clostridium botulinum]KEH99904.1 2-C-methyl-D-erythritol 4-phosphate cytidylyltransferase [Clostridium botulinum D str. 16868]KEI03776.1 2-C-methyl-D-erythritol 4-phosphate cytidylyltransferase [Clostridium botulinum C/D str. Sp77]KLU76352.1 2-C-methyl-D-erythritol 4-phosphate cytidylyltransferase [Clostridium botulinum V891]KOA73644.1 2-C-methyl-D-erythritol 4-phosphate cytidylyltransferase [Clostridium botulinum]KOA79655.1 2-C-methyl-D-erythritol 4-phosphate cytidylyl